MSHRPLVSYEPNPALAWLYHAFFEHIEVDAAWVSAVRGAEARGTVVYVLRNLSFVDFLALDYLTKRFKLPQVRFANDLGLSILEPMGRGWLRALRRPSEAEDAEDLRRAVEGGASAALFLKRPGNLLEGKVRGKIEGDVYIRTLFSLQRRSARPILLVPQVFVWSKNPDAAAHNAVDALLGRREWPGKIRTIAQFLSNYRNVTLRAGEPVDLKAFLASDAHDDAKVTSAVHASDAAPAHVNVDVDGRLSNANGVTATSVRIINGATAGAPSSTVRAASSANGVVAHGRSGAASWAPASNVVTRSLNVVRSDGAARSSRSSRDGNLRDVRDLRGLAETSSARAVLFPDESTDDDVRVRRITYTLLRRLERERRAVIGPTKKPADRLRAEVIRSPKLKKIIGDMAGDGKTERNVMALRALAMLKELEAALDMSAVSAFDRLFESVARRMYSDVELDREGLERLRAASKDGTLILLPSHKSHVDYMVLSHLFYHHHLQLPLIAAGDNLNFFPMGPLFRRAGAFFIRRSFRGDKLYTAVVDAYIRRLIKDGWSLEFFLEGGRSRSGKLLRPQVGILTMVVDAALGALSRDIYFCPISIGYERVAEEKSFVFEMSGGDKAKEDVSGLLSTANVVGGRYGKLNVQFGELLTLDGVLKEFDPAATKSALASMTPARRRAVITRLAYRVMNEINRVTAVTPGALVATALLTHGRRGLGHDELVSACERIAAALHRFGARFTPSLADTQGGGRIRKPAVREACELFVRAGHVEAHRPGVPLSSKERRMVVPGHEALYIVPDEARLALDLSKNIVVHFFVSRAMVATVLLSSPERAFDVAELQERVQSLSRLFKYEFSFRADAPFPLIFEEELAEMIAEGELLQEGSRVGLPSASPGSVPPCSHGRASLACVSSVDLYARIVRNFLEGYRVAARSLTLLLRGPLTAKELSKKAVAVGERMFLAGEIEQREAVTSAVFDNAYLAFVNQGYLARSDGKLMLPESLASADAIAAVEAKMAGYLRRPSGTA